MKKIILNKKEWEDKQYQAEKLQIEESKLIEPTWNFSEEVQRLFKIAEFENYMSCLRNIKLMLLLQDITIEEQLQWMDFVPTRPFELAKLLEWRIIGPLKTSMEGETNFVDPEIFEDLFKHKVHNLYL